MASQYYGRKGSTVKEYQRMLNSLGAGLAVDGIWGPKTEAAYNKYYKQFKALKNAPAAQSEPPAPPAEADSPIKAMDYAPRTDEDLRRIAENLYGSQYAGQLEDLERSARGNEQRLRDLIDSLDPRLERQLVALITQYEGARQQLSDQALSRGLGRSSYLTDQLTGNFNNQLDMQRQLQQDNERGKLKLEREIAQLLADLDTSKARLSADRERSISSAIDGYREQDQKLASDALKYNNSLAQREQERLEQIRQFEENLAVQKKKLKIK